MTNLITGAFSFSGRFIAEEALKTGEQVATLTGHPDSKSPFYDKIKIIPYTFGNFNLMVENFKGVDTFYNSYWIRFPHGDMTWKRAIINSYNLFRACKIAGVKKIIHISVTNCHFDSPYSYFKGKAIVEELLKRSGVPYTILRVAWFFEDNDILINDIAWILRRFPIFGLFGYGDYKLEPISAKTYAKIAVESRYLREKTINQNKIINVIGPETYTWKRFVSMINKSIGCKTLIIPFPGKTVFIPIIVSKMLGIMLKDHPLTIEEIKSLSDNLCFTNDLPIGSISFNNWLQQNSKTLGLKWNNEVKRHYY